MAEAQQKLCRVIGFLLPSYCFLLHRLLLPRTHLSGRKTEQRTKNKHKTFFSVIINEKSSSSHTVYFLVSIKFYEQLHTLFISPLKEILHKGDKQTKQLFWQSVLCGFSKISILLLVFFRSFFWCSQFTQHLNKQRSHVVHKDNSESEFLLRPLSRSSSTKLKCTSGEILFYVCGRTTGKCETCAGSGTSRSDWCHEWKSVFHVM